MQKSKLDSNKIRELIKQKYGIDVLKIEEINRGTANIFKIYSLNKNYILKEFSDGRTKDSVIKEINIINFLKTIKVPKYIKNNENEYYCEYENRIIILQEFIEGYTIENNTGDYRKTIESATLLGKLTKELQGYNGLGEDGIIEKSFSKEGLLKGIEKMTILQKNLNKDNPYRDIFNKDLEYKIKISKELTEKFDFEIIRKMTITNSHGDFSVQQMIYNDNQETTIIDFETAKKLPIMWEVLRSYSYIDKDTKDGVLNIDTLVKYVEEFSKYVSLNEYDLKYAAHIYLIQIVASVFGYKQFNDDYNKTDLLNFAFFRTNLCKFLYNNLDKISERLHMNI